MTKFKDYLNENKVKVKKELLLNLPAKRYTSSVPLAREIDKDIAKACDLMEKEGYYLLKNTKTYSSDMLISPEDLAKIPGATNAIRNSSSITIGRSEYEAAYGQYICNKTSIFKIEGEIVDTPEKSGAESQWFDAPVIRGIGLGALTQDIASSRVKDGKYSGYFNMANDSVVMHGGKISLNTKKPFITWKQQHSSSPWSYHPGGTVEFTEVSIRKMFPGAYNKSTIDKKNIFVIK